VGAEAVEVVAVGAEEREAAPTLVVDEDAGRSTGNLHRSAIDAGHSLLIKVRSRSQRRTPP